MQTCDRSASYEYQRLKEEDRRRVAFWSCFFWFFAALVLGSTGGYVMYTSMTPTHILTGLLLLFGAVVAIFLMICACADTVD